MLSQYVYFSFLCIRYLCLLQCWFSGHEFLGLFPLCFWMVTLLAIAAVFPQRTWNTSFWEFLAFSILLRNLLICGVFLYEWGGGFSLQFSVFFFCILCILTIKWEWESECLLYLEIHIFLKSWGFSAIVSLNRSYAFRLRVSTFYTNKNFGLLITSEILHSLFIIFCHQDFCYVSKITF